MLAVGKHVGEEPVAHVAGKRPQDETRFPLAAGGQREPFEADHRVASPVGEPVITRDDGSCLGAKRRCPGLVLGPLGRRHDKLIRRQHQLCADAGSQADRRLLEQLQTTVGFGLECRVRCQRLNGVPRFGRSHQRRFHLRRIGAEVGVKEPGRPQRAFVSVTARPFLAVAVRPARSVERQHRLVAVHPQTQMWQVFTRINLDALVDGGDRIRPRQCRVQRTFVMTNVQERT